MPNEGEFTSEVVMIYDISISSAGDGQAITLGAIFKKYIGVFTDHC